MGGTQAGSIGLESVLHLFGNVCALLDNCQANRQSSVAIVMSCGTQPDHFGGCVVDSVEPNDK